MKPRGGVRAAVVAVVLATGAATWLALWPCAYVGQRPTVVGAGHARVVGTCASLIAVNGLWVAGILLIPVLLSVGALVGALRGSLWMIGVAFGVLAVLCVLGIVTLGIWFAPAAFALGVAALRAPRPDRPARGEMG